MYLLICWVAEERNFAVKSIRRYSKNVGIRFRVIDVKDCNSDLRVLPADLISGDLGFLEIVTAG